MSRCGRPQPSARWSILSYREEYVTGADKCGCDILLDNCRFTRSVTRSRDADVRLATCVAGCLQGAVRVP